MTGTEPETAADSSPDRTAQPVTVAVVGAHGFGRHHLDALRPLAARGRARLVGVCDVRPVPDDALDGLADGGEVVVSADLGEVLDRTEPDITVVATPIQTHAPLAVAALRHGSNVLLEKPPAATWEAYQQIAAAAEEAGLAVQVGFQNTASPSMRAVRRMVEEGAIGTLRGIGGAANWHREAAYYARAGWAGRRRLDDGTPVVDGVLTNPLAHSVSGALWLAGATGPDDIEELELELFRANPIEADDTSVMRARTRGGITATVAATVCAPVQEKPFLLVQGDEGTLTLWYTDHRVRLARPGRTPIESEYAPAGPLENLVDHLAHGAALRTPLAESAAFMRVLDAIRTAPEPTVIDAPHARRLGEGDSAWTEVLGISDLVTSSAEKLALFSELGVAWAH
ncbi:hypothetical protein BIV57_22070 [Mangrovactinospora gilvigrisea]|uniref:Oxidoreductase n=1 Tax=Mangrovactinospora gilvigrisea TaxID=1428644 RepID=A0A1J7BPG3_9ACTN|nr:Gfo/Idh/MocA family oxidoreductase [Mangrovactinospora gilvigrisea]OIV35337.1 hypothetical protein BIV57_22070 [Mangrovactinospora gilvigrisea]